MKRGIFKRAFSIFLLLSLMSLVWSAPAFPWAEKTHQMINEAAFSKLPEDLYPFFKEYKAWMIYQAPEPDRWRGKDVYTLNNDTGPDHYLNLEKIRKADLYHDRFSYMNALLRRNLQLNEVGFLPFSIIETYQKLLVSFKEYQGTQSEEEKRAIGQNIAYYAGLLGHFVGDGSMPLHVTIHHDGWVGENPNGFATSGVHRKVESFTDAIIRTEDLLPLITNPQMIESPFDDVIDYIYSSHDKVEALYVLNEEEAFRIRPINPKGEEFIVKSVSQASQMLLNLWYKAYMESKE